MPADDPRPDSDSSDDERVLAGEADSAGTLRFLKRLALPRAQKQRYGDGHEFAHGGMGRILRVFDSDLRRRLAMKVMLHPPREGADDDSLPQTARFLKEAQVTGQLEHPGIVPVYELGVDESGCPYFTMRLVKGRDLRRIFELVFAGEEGWNQTRALGVLLRVCEALAYAHKKGVVHRDLKPANVMVGSFGEVYVMDWGLARVAGLADTRDLRIQQLERDELAVHRAVDGAEASDSSLQTMDGHVLGTPAYMPPEQARGEIAKLSARSDVYALGAMLYHLLAGQMPYAPAHGNLSALGVLKLVLDRPPRPLSQMRKDVPAELIAICERAMAREPEQRYADMNELAEDLRAYLERRVVRAYQTGALAELRKWFARNRAVALTGIVALIALVVAVAIQVRSRADTELAGILLRTQQVARLVREADELWPPREEIRAASEAWLRRARTLVAGEDGGLGLPAVRVLRDQRLREIARIQGDPHTDPFVRLCEEMESIADPERGLIDGVSPRYGWGVALRLAKLDAIEAVPSSWTEARSAIADEARTPIYHGTKLEEQTGLLPLGPDPRTGLWEFADLLTGTPARRASDGTLLLDEATGLVLVLIPGGTFTMGSQGTVRAAPSFDPHANTNEGPPHEVTLAPFFLSKYELTQAQWVSLHGKNPSLYHPPGDESIAVSGMNPVEQVSWSDANKSLRRLGLVLPTEAQWEYAARAGTTSVWWTGDDRGSLEGACNLADQSLAGKLSIVLEAWNDQAPIHTRIGGFRANAFGLFDMLGNVQEWCADVFDWYRAGAARPGDGLQGEETDKDSVRVLRGGAWDGDAITYARSAARAVGSQGALIHNIGLRPARAITSR